AAAASRILPGGREVGMRFLLLSPPQAFACLLAGTFLVSGSGLASAVLTHSSLSIFGPLFLLSFGLMFYAKAQLRRPSGAEGSHGTARWGDPRSLRRPDGLILGRSGRDLLRYEAEGHILTVAPTGSGKGVSAVIPNLLDYPGSVVVVDLKGENHAVTA